MKICIDPGHGMSNRVFGIYDPGAVHFEHSYQFQEAAIVLRYGLALKDAFRSRGVDVFMTRDDDTDHTPVAKRTSMAAASGCDTLISIHLNDLDDDRANGCEVLYGNSQSKVMAQSIQSKLVKLSGMKDRKIKLRNDLAVLKFRGAAVIIELGFIANDQDRQKLTDSQMRDAIVGEIAACVLEKQ